MYVANFLSTLNREKLKEIEYLLQNSTSTDERAELFAKREKIEGKRKPLHECNLVECMEFSNQLYEQLQQHVNLGNRTQVKQFQSMISNIQQRTLTLHTEKNNEALAKQAAAEKKNRLSVDDEDDESTDGEKSGRSAKKRTTSNRWTISVDKFD